MRRRPILSCLNCRSRRVRCDKARPICRRCTISNLNCTYASDVQDPAESLQDNEIDTPPFLTAQGTVSGGTPGQDEQLPDLPSLDDPSPLADAGFLFREGEGRSQYLGPTFWGSAILSNYQSDDRQASFFRRLPHWAQRPRNEGGTWKRLIDAPPEFSDIAGMCSLCGAPFSLECCLALLPSKIVCHSLCNAFFTNVYPLIPIMHIPSFKRDYDSFWGDLQQNNKHKYTVGTFQRRKPDFISLLFAIMYSGVSTLSTTQAVNLVGRETRDFTEGLYFATIKSASLVGFPRRPSLYSLSSYVIAEMQLLREEDFPDPPAHINTSFRVALSMGLHRDSKQFKFPESEIRRRIWWYIIHLDVMMSASSGLSPLFIDEKMANATNISQSDISEEDTDHDLDNGDVRYIVARYRYNISKTLRTIVREQFEGQLRRKEDLSRAARNLSKLAKSIFAINGKLLPENLNPEDRYTTFSQHGRSPSIDMAEILDHSWMLSIRTTDQLTDKFCSWAAILLHLMIHKAYCVLYQPTMKRGVDTIAASTRTIAVKHAQAFLLLFITISTDTRSVQYRWMYPGIYQPLQPLSLLLSDLLRYPHSDEATTSRGLIDAIFELYQVDHGIVSRPTGDLASISNSSSAVGGTRALSDSGKGSWLMLIRARTKALEAVGHDPHVLLPHRSMAEETCICGAPIRVRNLEAQRGVFASRNIFEPDRGPSLDTAGVDEVGTSSGHHHQQQQQEMASFDWDEFDALLGDGVGFLA